MTPDTFERECFCISKDKPIIKKIYPFIFKFCSKKCLDDAMEDSE